MPTFGLSRRDEDALDERGLESLRRLRALMILLAVIIALLLPGLRAWFGSSSLQQGLEIEVNQLADEFSQRASLRPEVWRFERNALEAEIAAALLRARFDAATLSEVDGTVIVSSGRVPGFASLQSSAPVLDSGVEVARITLASSLRDLVASVLFVAALGVAIGVVFYLLVTRITYRSLSQSMREIQTARHEAIVAGRARAQFLATMSHEIRTPMNGVIGMTSLLLETPLDRKQREYLETIRSSGDALVTVINDILEFSKIDSGKLTLNRQPFDPASLVEEVLTLLAPEASQKQLELACEIAPGVPTWVNADGTRLRQVLLNLVGNAIKFTGHGEVIVTLDAPSLSRLRFAVRDTGIGVSQEERARIFAPFEQADSSTTRRFGGTGLGLAISQRIAEAMGGAIEVESNVGSGSVFSLEIEVSPVERPHVPSDQAHALPDLSGLAGKTALIVDDNQSSLNILSQLCEAWGMTTLAFRHADDALAVLGDASRAAKVAMVLFDDRLPGSGGWSFAQRAHTATTGRADVPMILLAMTGMTTYEPRHLYAACVDKPVRRAQVMDALHEVIPSRSTRADAPSAPQHAITPSTERAIERSVPAAVSRPETLRILIVEDNEVNAAVIQAMVQSLGHDDLWVDGGAKAIAAVQAAAYDLVFMDMRMPEMDGLEATRQIRQLASKLTYRPYIVALTANVMKDDRTACLAAGMDDFLTKPITLDALRDYLEVFQAARQAD